MPSFSTDREAPILNSITVTPSIVYDKLRNIKSDKSPGPEGWPVLVLKETARELSLPLCILFTKSLQSLSVPEVWKQAFVTPIHKKVSVVRQKIIVRLVLHQKLGRYLSL